MAVSPAPSVLRASQLLHTLAQDPTRRWTVTELASELGIPRATADTIVRALNEYGFVGRDRLRRYHLGSACLLLGEAASRTSPKVAAAAAASDRLAVALGAVTAVTIRDDVATRVAHLADHGPPVGVRVGVGQSIPLAPPYGAVHVAWDDALIATWLDRASPALDEAARQRHQEALEAVRHRGFSALLLTDDPWDSTGRITDRTFDRPAAVECLPAHLDSDDKVLVAHVSAPVFDHTGTVVAAVMLLGPGYPITGADVTDLGTAVQAAASGSESAMARPLSD